MSRSRDTADSFISKAPVESPTFSGTVTVPTPSTGTAAANKNYVDSSSGGGSEISPFLLMGA